MKILMVCLGNICRSPIAEGVLRTRALDADLPLIVDSCGFERYHLGDAPDKRAVEVCKTHGVDISGLRQRLFKAEDFDRFDRIYVMDANNYKDVKRMARTPEDMEKVAFLMDVVYPNASKPVPDPYYGDSFDFENAFHLIDVACVAIVKSLIVKQTSVK
jgi:protein-tyrosine phosphatase